MHDGSTMILVADQNRATADLLVRRLRTDGFAAESAASSAAMVTRVEAGGVAALVLDPGLPGSALQALRRLRSNAATSRLPVVVFGTSDRPQDSNAAMEAGASLFLVKGRISPAQLVQRIRSLLSTGNAPSAVKTDGSSTEHGAYYVGVTPGADANRLAGDIGAAPGMRCPDCKASLSLYLQRDFSRWGKWLFGTFGCLVCARKAAPTSPPATEPQSAHGGFR